MIRKVVSDTFFVAYLEDCRRETISEEKQTEMQGMNRIHLTLSSKPLLHIQLIRFDVSISANYIYDDIECHIDHPLNGYLPCGGASMTLLHVHSKKKSTSKQLF